MALTVNMWLMMSPTGATELAAAAQIPPPPVVVQGPRPRPAKVSAASFPMLDYLSDEVLWFVSNYPERYRGIMPIGTWNCMIRVDDLSDMIPIREELQDLMGFYPDDYNVVGWWDYFTGQPIGGVGSPWFQTPEGVERIDTVLGSGQAPRKFV